MNAIAQAIATRRSVYALNRELPLPPGEIVATIEHALRHAPSAFNSQSTRLLVLFGADGRRPARRRPGGGLRADSGKNRGLPRCRRHRALL